MTTFIIITLTVLVGTLLALVYTERRAHARERAGILKEWRDERTELMNRVQHPQVFQPRPSDVRPAVQTPQDDPSDLADLARVGGIVPGDFFDER